ncbi:MAG: type I methionyl aminopeptidase [Flammeovirgaceae bacterium]
MVRSKDIIYYKTSEELDIIRQAGVILGQAHGEVAKYVKEGVTTKFLDKIAYEFIKDNQASPSFLGFKNFPASLCISVNEVVVHGIPSTYQLKSGDIVSIDCGVFYKGFHADSAYTYPVGKVSAEVEKLLKVTKESLYEGIRHVKVGAKMGDVSYAIQSYVEKHGFSVVRELVGHGVGRNLHEKPEVPNYGSRGQGQILLNGLVIAIEPMINLGKRMVVQERDGWTIRTKDRLPSAHYEHTVAIFNNKVEIMTTFEHIEKSFKQ